MLKINLKKLSLNFFISKRRVKNEKNNINF